MNLHSLHYFSNNFICNLLKEYSFSILDENYTKNYNFHYANLKKNLFYQLENGEFAEGKGCYYVLENSNTYVCSAGWRTYNQDTALLLSRAYVDPDYRGHFYLAEYILPECISQTSNFKNRYITVNKYNKYLLNGLLRPGLSPHWPKIYRKFKFLGIQTINHTEQYVFDYND